MSFKMPKPGASDAAAVATANVARRWRRESLRKVQKGSSPPRHGDTRALFTLHLTSLLLLLLFLFLKGSSDVQIFLSL
jgi:hypothetical protein